MSALKRCFSASEARIMGIAASLEPFCGELFSKYFDRYFQTQGHHNPINLSPRAKVKAINRVLSRKTCQTPEKLEDVIIGAMQKQARTLLIKGAPKTPSPRRDLPPTHVRGGEMVARVIGSLPIYRFMKLPEWRAVRYETIKRYGRICMACGARAPDVEIHVNHIRSRSMWPELAFDPDNLQVLCKECNFGKADRDQTDWRPRP